MSAQPLMGGKAYPGVGNFSGIAAVTQVVLAGLFASLAVYDQSEARTVTTSSVFNYYVGVALMMFVGFGYLMTFLKHYGLGAVGLTMFVTCLGVQWALLVEPMVQNATEGETFAKIPLSFMSLLNANFAVAAVLISFGALIGKVNPAQLTLITLFELFFYAINKVCFMTNWLDIKDCGATIMVHMFGAYFGLTVSYVLGHPRDESFNKSGQTSDVFSLIGTVMLWLYWPAFVSGGLPAGTVEQNTALLNTVFALLGSTVITFCMSPLFNEGKLDAVSIQNATLAGGVSIGATANFAMGPGVALTVGVVAGMLSTWGFCQLILPAHDTCGVNNLHGMPSILGGLFSAFLPMILHGTGISAAAQLMGIVVTIGFAVATGFLTGTAVKSLSDDAHPFNDKAVWAVADDFAKDE